MKAVFYCPKCKGQDNSLIDNKEIVSVLAENYKIESSLAELTEGIFSEKANTTYLAIVNDLVSCRTTIEKVLSIAGDRFELNLKCNNCGNVYTDEAIVYYADELHLFIGDWLYKECEKILIENTNLRIKDISEHIDEETFIRDFIANLRNLNEEKYGYLAILLKVKDELPIVGGKGGGYEELAYYLETVALGIISAIIFEIMKYGVTRGIRLIKRISLRKKIRDYIKSKNYNFDFEQITVNDLGRYISIDKNLTISEKKEIIEEIALNHALHIREQMLDKVTRNE